jgi:two-component system nitrogen regulation response regulator NtrX
VFSKENGVREKQIDAEVLDALSERGWPGNVRELKNVVERMVILSGDGVTLDDLPPEGRIRETPAPFEPHAPQSAGGATSSRSTSGSIPPEPGGGERLTLREFRDKAEADYITATLKAYDWNISRASVVLGVERTNLHKKMRALNIRREGGSDS